MHHAKYLEDGFLAEPRPENIAQINFLAESDVPRKTLSFGVKTMIETGVGLKVKPHKTLVIEIKEGVEVATFDIPASFTRQLAGRFIEFADAIETEKAS